MNNRVGMAVVGVVAAVAIIFAIVQSGNLSQTQTNLSAAQSTATAQQVAMSNQGTAAVATLSAASTQAADSANTALTAQANALTEAQNAAATAEAKALTDAQNAAATAQAKALADAAKAASTVQAQVLAAASQAAATAEAQAVLDAQNAAATAQASAVTNSQNAAATAQASAISALQNKAATAQAQATATLGAVIDAASQAQASAVKDAQNAAATEQGQAISTIQAQATATLGVVVAQAATNASEIQQSYSATQMALATELAQANDAVATAQANISANPGNPTVAPTDATPTPTNEAGAVPKDWKRYVGKGVAIQLPNTYIGSELGSDPKALGTMLRALGPDFEAAAALLEQNPDILAFIAVNAGGNGVAPSSVIVVSIPMPVKFSLNTLLEATVNQLPKGSRVIERSLVQLGDYEAGRMIVQTKVGSIVSNQLQYYIIQNNMLYLVGFTGTPDNFDSQLDSFEQSMKTFEILAKPGI